MFLFYNELSPKSLKFMKVLPLLTLVLLLLLVRFNFKHSFSEITALFLVQVAQHLHGSFGAQVSAEF